MHEQPLKYLKKYDLPNPSHTQNLLRKTTKHLRHRINQISPPNARRTKNLLSNMADENL